MIRVIVADDYALMREGVRKVLSNEDDMMLVGEAENPDALLSLVSTVKADAVVLDTNLRGSAPVSTLQNIRARNPGLPVLVLSRQPDQGAALEFIRAGAAGFVSKSSPLRELVAALRKVASGGHYVSPEIAENVLLNAQPASSHETLSTRELQVLRLIASGKPVKIVARELNLSVSTVHTYRTRIRQKLNVDSDVELARYAFRHRLVE